LLPQMLMIPNKISDKILLPEGKDHSTLHNQNASLLSGTINNQRAAL
jgi:hypothetical protein